ncbi:MAG TPA: NADPH-dependent assimilatory sulfite reductase hemoprotein subunit [Acetobacteraceae bacterium]|nr:NADPH-dependent assimilatory sulfite reductase hemoprotein subunit [Acetobacteraceae bacterium]
MADEKKLSRNETIKEESRFLRGSIAEGLHRAETGALSEDDTQLTKFHGIYQQDDRDLRAERGRKKMEKAFSFMARLRIPGGTLTPAQWLALDDIAQERANGTIRLTTRQTVQFHGIIKTNLRPAIAAINRAMLDTVAACGDVNRNVIATSNPYERATHGAVVALARAVSLALLPKSRAYHEIWIGDELVAGGEEEDEPIYGRTYLPRKFKIAITVPPHNDVDVFAHDLGFIAIVEDGRIAGYNVTAGGGMGMTHGEPDTFPRTGDVLGFCAPDQVIAVAEQVVTTQRDFGDRADRKHARLKYTIERMGVDGFRAELERRLGFALAPARPFHLEGNGDRYGWREGDDGLAHYTLFVENGRIADTGTRRLLSGLRAIAGVHAGTFVLTCNQNLTIAQVAPDRRPAIDALLAEYGLDGDVTALRRHAMACVALPTCGLALAESERYLPSLVTELDAVMARLGLAEDAITLRMTGCPNGCARPYLAEIGLVGRGPGTYNLYLGAAFDGSRLNKLYMKDVSDAAIVAALTPLLEEYARDRESGERFGDFVIRRGHVQATVGGNRFHADLAPGLAA